MSPSLPAPGRAPFILLALLLASAAGCGKKGPPLAPLITLPRAPEALTARLQADQVQIRFRIPRATQSNVQPADLQRVDVYALTAERIDREDFLEDAVVVASVPVRQPVEEGEEDRPPAPGEEESLEQGAMAVVYETLTPEAYKPVTLEEEKETPRPRRREGGPIVVRRTAIAPPDVGVRVVDAPVRHYAAVGVTRGGRSGMPSAVVPVPLAPPPPAGPAPRAEVRESAAVALTWDSPPGLRQPIQRTTLLPPTPVQAGRPRRGGPAPSGAGQAEDPDVFGDPEDEEDADAAEPDPAIEEPPALEAAPAVEEEPSSSSSSARPAAQGDAPPGGLPKEGLKPRAGAEAKEDGEPAFLPARPLLPWPSVLSGYHVYAVPAEAPEERPSPYSADALPELLTPRPIPKPEYVDAKAQFGDERCYVIRVAEIAGAVMREGPPSAPTCVKVADVFPPAAPRSLEAVASDGAVNLIWEAGGEPDLAGYIVVRSEGAETRVQQLTPKPIAETTFRDARVKPGVRYVYVVVAVDRADPPNRSGPSNAVEVTAR